MKLSAVLARKCAALIVSVATVALCHSAKGAVTQINYYWTGNAGDEKWSSAGNWALDAKGTKPATTYPGATFTTDTTYDSANILLDSATNIVVDVDVTLWRIMFGNDGCNNIPLVISGPSHTVNLVNTGNNMGDRTHIYRETHVRDVTINVNYWDTRRTTYFESGAKVTVKIDLGMWSANSRFYVEDGAEVAMNSTSYCSSIAPVIVVNGGTLSGKLTTHNDKRGRPHKVTVNDGNVTLNVLGNSGHPELAGDITVNGGTVELNKLTYYGDGIVRMTGGTLSLNNACSAKTQFSFTGGRLVWLGGEPSEYGDYSFGADELWSQESLKRYFLNTLTVPANSVYHWTRPTTVRTLRMEAGARLILPAAGGGITADAFELDETASIEVAMTNELKDAVHPLVVGGPKADDITSRVTVTGDVPAGWEVRRDLKCVYLWKDALWDPEALSYQTNVWTGASSAGNNIQDAANWKGGKLPVGGYSQVLRYGGLNLVITNTTANSNLTQGKHVILEASGPAVLTGEKFNFYNFGSGKSGDTLINLSPLPLIFRADVYSKNDRSEMGSYGAGFIAFDGDYDTTDKSKSSCLNICGHVKFVSDTSIPYGLHMSPGSSSALTRTICQVMRGAHVTVKNQRLTYTSNANFGQLYDRKNSFLQVDEGATLTYANGPEALFGWMDIKTVNRIYGNLDIQCPMTGKGVESYYGPGRMHVASTFATNANFTVRLGGGIHFSAGEFATAGAERPEYARKIEIAGDATFEATNSWRYAVEEGVTTTSDEANRTLTVATNAVLTIATSNGAAIVLGERIEGEGTLCFASGARLEFTPSMGITANAWRTVATVKSVVGLPTNGNLRFRVVENADGSQSLQCREKSGFCLYVQ